jgi:hypothetical protein
MELLDWVVWINYFPPLLWNTILASSFGLHVPNKKKAESFGFLLLGGLSLYLSLSQKLETYKKYSD